MAEAKVKTTQKRKIAPVKPPKRFVIRETDKELIISWRWFDEGTIGLTIFAIVWSVPVFLLNIALIQIEEQFAVWMIIPILLGLVGVLLVWSTLARLFNTTTVTISDHKITTRIRPIPVAFKNPVFYAKDIEQVYVREYFTETSKRKHRTYLYDVLVLFYGDHTPQTLIYALEHRDYALYLEQEIETYLGIRDREIADENEKHKL